jgi:catechol 2,3-dioxygenase-like lactoylglutathione lyase family enzyme
VFSTDVRREISSRPRYCNQLSRRLEYLISLSELKLVETQERIPGEKPDGNERWCAGPLQVSTRKLKETVRFYEDVLGFVNGPRPQFNFRVAWLYSAGHAVLHFNDISETNREQRPDSGVIDHIAFGSRGFEAMKEHLTGKGVPYRVNQVPNGTPLADFSSRSQQCGDRTQFRDQE